MTHLFPFQQAIVEQVFNHWESGKRNVLVKSPTGSGKTVVTAAIIKQLGVATASIAHRGELVTQKSLALGREGIKHRVIGPDSLRRECVAVQMAELGKHYYDPNARVGVCSVDTLTSKASKGDAWFSQVQLWDMDECFPSDTLIDGRPIETIAIGDTVRSFNEDSGVIVSSKVTHVFKRHAPKHMVRLTLGHHVLNCTPNHPFFTRRGWAPAYLLRTHDEVLHMSEASNSQRRSNEILQKDGKGLLQQGMCIEICKQAFIGNDGGNEQEICFGSNDEKQSDVSRRNPRKNETYSHREGALPEDSRGERKTAVCCRNGFTCDVFGIGVCASVSNQNRSQGEKCREDSNIIQGRFGQPLTEDCDRSRWYESYVEGAQGTRQEENELLEWVRLDSLEIYECSNHTNSGHSDSGSYVYNLEVENTHTYLVDGFVVHNCHHVLRENKWGKAVSLFHNARGLGVTATPARADGKGLGAHADGFFEEIVQGPTPRDLIKQGFLTDYRVFAPPSDIDYSAVPITSTGDYSPAKLRAVVHESGQIVGDVVSHYLRLARGKLGVTFAVDVEAAKELCDAYRAAGVPAEIVTAKTPALLRSQILRRFKARQVLQLVNVDLFGEGFDLPAIEVVSMVRKTESWPLYCQQFGRALRVMVTPDLMVRWGSMSVEERLAHIAASEKPRALIIDHVGNVVRYSVPDAPRFETLDRRERRGSSQSDAIPLRVCANPVTPCALVYPRYMKVCPYCGYYPEPQRRDAPEFVDGDLTELSPETLAALRGEIERIDGPARIPQHLGAIAAMGLTNRHRERQEAQVALRATMALWAGWQRHKGHDDSEAYRRFYHAFGIDVLGAQALGRPDAEKLTERVQAILDQNGVIEDAQIS